MNADCLFCKIADGRIPVKKVYEDDLCLCFADRDPQAPTHLLMIPKEHIASHADMEERHAGLMGHLMAKTAAVALDAGLTAGYRVVINTREDGGQTVAHLHIHVLGGRRMGWPPG